MKQDFSMTSGYPDPAEKCVGCFGPTPTAKIPSLAPQQNGIPSIHSLNGSVVENHLSPLDRVVGRFDDQMRNRLLLYQRWRAVVVDALEMKSQVDPLTVRLAARRTLVRPFPRVRLLVRLEVSKLRVGVVADRTHVRLLARVGSHVNCQRVLVDERLQSQRTIIELEKILVLILSHISSYVNPISASLFL